MKSGLELEPRTGNRRGRGISYSLDPYVEVSHRPSQQNRVTQAEATAHHNRLIKRQYTALVGLTAGGIALALPMVPLWGAALAFAAGVAFMWFCTEVG